MTEADPVLLESVHDLRTAPGGPALVLTSGPPGVSSAALVATGAVADVTKPVRLRVLADAVRSAAGHPRTDVTWRGRRQVARPGTRVLVVEDNPVNQMVAQGYLESLGIAVEIAADGVEAVDRLLRDQAPGPPVDAVLMDCRMPRLDGYAATRAIRAAEDEGERPGRLPIIAMTASALDAERDRCLAAGMDDFLAKPVEPDQLTRMLARWLPGALPRTLPGAPADTRSGQAAPGRPRPAPAVAQVLDADRAEMLAELVKDGVNFFDRTRASFLSRIDATLGALSEAVERDDSPRTMAVAHQLKGSALNLGLGLLGDAAHALEQLARADETDGADALLAQVRLQATAAVEALVAYPA